MKFGDSTIPFFLSSNTCPPSAKQLALTTPFLFTLKLLIEEKEKNNGEIIYYNSSYLWPDW